MKTTRNIVVFLLLAIGVGSVTAGSIRCQGEIIRDDQIKPLSEAQVREKCGKPAAEEFRVLTYKTGANVSKVLRFNDAGDLENITEEIGE
jgi:hypothetical protein